MSSSQNLLNKKIVWEFHQILADPDPIDVFESINKYFDTDLLWVGLVFMAHILEMTVPAQLRAVKRSACGLWIFGEERGTAILNMTVIANKA